MRSTIRIMIVLAASVFSLEARAAEICGNGIDDDGDLLVDEQCYPGLTTGQCENPLSCGDTGDVSPSTGSLRYQLPPDVSPQVPYGPGIGFHRFYVSQYAPGGGAPNYRKPFGERWGHSYMSWLDKNTTPAPDQVVIHLPRGQDAMFQFTSTVSGWDEYKTYQPGFHFQYLRQRVASPNEYELKTLTGEVLAYDVNGKLIEIRDSLATPNKVLLAYSGGGDLLTVTDASGKRRLLFTTTSGKITAIDFQINFSGTWTTQHTTSYAYTSSNLTSVTIGGQLAQTNVYTSNYLTSIQDGGSKTLVNFAYDGATAGKIVRVDTPRGVVGYEYAPSRTECSGATKTALYFHKANATTCTTDSDCGTGNLCGGKTGAGATGQCFRGARCMTVSSPSEDLITTVSSFAGNSETCDGACLDAIDHVWNTTSGVLDLTAIKDPSSNYTTREFNPNGLPTRIVYGDANSTPGGGTREVYLTYGNASFPGLVTEARRQSELDTDTCLPGNSTPCARTLSTFTADGKLDTVQEIIRTTDVSGNTVSVTYTTDYTFDSKGRLAQIDGPLSSIVDLTVFEFFSSADPLKDGFVQNFKRKKDSTNYLVQSALTYDFWGNATSVSDVDGTISCQTFDAARGYVTQRREQMAGQTDCTANAADLVTSYARDSALRLTQLTRPDGSCLINEYDSRGRLSKVKRRDDCNPASAGDTEELTYSDDGLVTKTELKDSAGTVKKRQELTYFDSRRLEKMLNPINVANWTAMTWDSRGLIDSIAALESGSDMSKTQWTYNAEGRTASEKRLVGGGVFDTWTLAQDWTGNQENVTDGTSKQTTSTRDDLGRVIKLSGNDFAYNAGQSSILRVYDAASRLVKVKEAFGITGTVTHSFSFDNVNRPLNDDHNEQCFDYGFGGYVNAPDIVRVYDAISGAPGVTCPFGTGNCDRSGKLIYVRAKLMCQPDTPGHVDPGNGDWMVTQETFYQYDAAGRVTREYVRDETGRIADHLYSWTKNGALEQVTLPSTVVLGAAFGSGTSNSDKDRVTALWRTTTGTPIIDNILYEPFGPVAQYNQQNSPGTGQLRTRITRNLAYRQTSNVVEKTDGTSTQSSVTLVEDNKGRTTQRDYYPSDPTLAGRYDSFYTYDRQDRLICEATTSGACPSSGSTLKNKHDAIPAFTAAGDWKSLLRPIPGSTGIGHTLSLYTTTTSVPTHWLYTVDQSTGTPALGMTYHGRDSFNARSYDDNTSTQTHDTRYYTLDDRHNVINIHGQYYDSVAWSPYDVTSTFDSKNRRVSKTFMNSRIGKTASWFFYYDAVDRLAEVRYTPDTSAATTYSLFQLIWLDQKLIAYWQTDYPSVTTSKRYVATDEVNRPVDMMSWPASGPAARVWTINADAWGNDTVLVGGSVFQPILFAGQFKDEETTSWLNDGMTRHRPSVVLNGFRTYDPWIGSYIQIDPLLISTWSSYVYVNSNPISKLDPTGLRDNDYITCAQACNNVPDYNSCLFTCEGSWGGSGGGGGGGDGGGGGGGSHPPGGSGDSLPSSCYGTNGSGYLPSSEAGLGSGIGLLGECIAPTYISPGENALHGEHGMPEPCRAELSDVQYWCVEHIRDPVQVPSGPYDQPWEDFPDAPPYGHMGLRPPKRPPQPNLYGNCRLGSPCANCTIAREDLRQCQDSLSD